MRKPEFVNIFLTQLLKDEYRKHRIKPSKLIRVFGDDIEINYTQGRTNIRLLVEWTNSFIRNASDYYYNAKLNNSNTLSTNTIEIILSGYLLAMYSITGFLIRNAMIGLGTCNVRYNNFSIDFSFSLIGPTILCIYLNKIGVIMPSLYKSTLIYNGNDVFFIPYFDSIDGDEDFDYDILFDTLNDDIQIALLCPHDTYENFVIAYADGNGGYTTTKPENIEFDLSIVDNNAQLFNPDWIAITYGNDSTSDETIRIENALLSIKPNWKKFYSGDFSELSVVDDIVIELPSKVVSMLADLEDIIENMYEQ